MKVILIDTLVIILGTLFPAWIYLDRTEVPPIPENSVQTELCWSYLFESVSPSGTECGIGPNPTIYWGGISVDDEDIINEEAECLQCIFTTETGYRLTMSGGEGPCPYAYGRPLRDENGDLIRVLVPCDTLTDPPLSMACQIVEEIECFCCDDETGECCGEE